jgi:hypothetical protein
MRYVFFTLMICLLLISCTKEIDMDAYWQCHHSQNPDSASITAKLPGSWNWKKQNCFWGNKARKADKNVTVTFYANADYTVTENSAILAMGTWRLKKVDVNLWEFDLSTPSEYLYGRILLCGNEVLLNQSYIDGCDNLFVKQD